MRPTDREPAHRIEIRQEKTRAVILEMEQGRLIFSSNATAVSLGT